MKITKQTVYLAVIEHNVFCEYKILNKEGVTEHLANKQEVFVFTPEQLNEYISNVIKEALENAADKAKTTYVSQWSNDECVDKNSITNTLQQTFDKFKV